MKFQIWFAIACLISCGLTPIPAVAEKLSTLDNGVLRIGVDLDVGGSITFLAPKGGDNLINSR